MPLSRQTILFSGALLLAYLALYLYPTFLEGTSMVYFQNIISNGPIIGGDLNLILSFSRELYNNWNPYISTNIYPPLEALIFLPLTTIDFIVAYRLFTVLSVLIFFLGMIVLPYRSYPKQLNYTVLILLTLIAFTSYGFQFEIEHGQFNLFTMGICLTAIYLFQFTNLRLLASVLFIIAVHLKIFPLIFIVFFIKRSLFNKKTIAKLIGLCTATVAMLWVLGPTIFRHFVNAYTSRLDQPIAAVFNHSIASFVQQNQQISLILTSGILLSFGLVILPMLTSHVPMIERLRYVLPLAGILACVIPSVSYDYKLIVLPLTFVYYLSLAQQKNYLQQIIYFCVAVLFVATTFCYTNFTWLAAWNESFINKAPILLLIYGLIWLDTLLYLYSLRGQLIAALKKITVKLASA